MGGAHPFGIWFVKANFDFNPLNANTQPALPSFGSALAFVRSARRGFKVLILEDLIRYADLRNREALLPPKQTGERNITTERFGDPKSAKKVLYSS
jgi:hypothetical protein